jgi:hypothetical protein
VCGATRTTRGPAAGRTTRSPSLAAATIRRFPDVGCRRAGYQSR